MPSPEPPSPVPEVPVEEQFIVGFGNSTFDGDAATARLNVDTALSTLLVALPATLLKKFVGTFEDEQKAWCAIAVIRLDGPDPTLAYLQKELETGKQNNKPGYVHIEWVEHNAPIALSFNDPLSAPLSQWALPRIGVTSPAWTVAPPAGAARTIVAIVDSGLRLPGGGLHEDLDPARVVPVADSQPPLPPFFYLNNVDREGHGTLLAGTVAAVTNNNLGIASPVHPGWNIHLMAVKFFEPPRAAHGRRCDHRHRVGRGTLLHSVRSQRREGYQHQLARAPGRWQLVRRVRPALGVAARRQQYGGLRRRLRGRQ